MVGEQTQTERNIQIKKLLQAIANYCPSQQEIENMQAAKLEMQKNIQKKFYLSQINPFYKFPFTQLNQHDYQDDDLHDLILIDNKSYPLKNQNQSPHKLNKSLTKEKPRPPLREKSANKLTLHNHHDKSQHQSHKIKSDYSLVTNIQQVFKNNLKCQTAKVIKKQIILTNKKSGEEKTSLKSYNKQYQSNNFASCSDQNESTGIRTKLKIKKPNSSLNETRKVHLKTQNNVTFENKHHQCSIMRKQNDYEERQQPPKPIYEQPSLEDSLFNSSRINLNMDENSYFECPSKATFNVYELKEKLRDTSNSSKKAGIKKHKRTATQGDSASMVKIKLFTHSFRKEDFRELDEEPKHNVSTHLFMKKAQTPYSHTMAERTVRSTLSQHSLKKGISVCGKTKQYDEKSQQKQKKKLGNRSESTQFTRQRKQDNKDVVKCFEKSQTKNFTIILKPSENKKKEVMESKSVRKQVSAQKGITLSTRKQNYETARIEKISSIMLNLKEEYRNKNSSKSRTGIKMFA